MDPRHLTKRQPRASAYDWRGHLKPWARAVTEELTRLWQSGVAPCAAVRSRKDLRPITTSLDLRQLSSDILGGMTSRDLTDAVAAYKSGQTPVCPTCGKPLQVMPFTEDSITPWGTADGKSIPGAVFKCTVCKYESAQITA
ncbi:hypothetical protein GCM10010844_07470 [Deinococcus radiotolerans]|uniref:Uncharacterized protein n=1 Tax=Deinococcus radiotolerans TaxID=1309407 RepID=A0ABQ2FI23_9DEIO|nr:hypothetical protein GCM10010844_07470 [Deinococcus radiotolerans]